MPVAAARRPSQMIPLQLADPDDLPASWTLIGITGLVWAGVVVLGVYATLLMV